MTTKKIRGVIETARVAAGDVKVTPLGQRDGTYYFMSRIGERRGIHYSRLTENGLLSLFDGDDSWLVEHYPRRTSKGEATGDFAARDAAAGLMRMCADVGLYDEQVPVRGVGVWPGAGGLVVHCGDVLLVEGGWRRAGQRIDGALYPAFPARARPAERWAGPDEGAWLLEAISGWPWVEPLDAELVAGWVFVAMLGAAPAWRPHLSVSGLKGSGKSWLARLIANVLGPPVDVETDFTAAGLQYLLSGEAHGVVLDETEGGGRMVQVVELIRLMSGGDGARVRRGTPDGGVRSHTVTGAVYMSAINPPVLLPQDRSRITELELGRLPDEGGAAMAARQGARAALETAARLSPALRLRAVMGFERWLANCEAYRAALAGAGCNPRQIDQLAALLAGRDALILDEATGAGDAVDQVRAFSGLVERARAEDESDDPDQCWRLMLSAQVEAWRGGHKATIGQLILDARDQGAAGAGAAREGLKAYGMRLEYGLTAPPKASDEAKRRIAEMHAHLHERREPCLLVANEHQGLSRIYDRTRWKDGGWVRALRRLQGSEAYPVAVQMGGPKVRCTYIPPAHLPSNRFDDGGGG